MLRLGRQRPDAWLCGGRLLRGTRDARRPRGAAKRPEACATVAARRVDGDGNGFLTDAQDRIWIDLNGDGKFDATSEQFLYNSVLNLEGSRYVVLSDQLGTRLAFEPLLGTATLRLAVAPKRERERLDRRRSGVEIRVTAIGRDGSVFALTGTEPATVPAGDYRVSDVTISPG